MAWGALLGPDLIPAATALASLGLMRAAFFGVARAGGREQAMRPGPHDRLAGRKSPDPCQALPNQDTDGRGGPAGGGRGR